MLVLWVGSWTGLLRTVRCGEASEQMTLWRVLTLDVVEVFLKIPQDRLP